ncbi:Uncharacterised protein [Neisseria zoodegmatis]|uniref:Uncharacterized protein n=1 Tax=Neisseria zoodegmatis TaxID=326523 RepID=A0AB38DNB9_9NEIS|nr:Uncharacterised protein [Neisseria zoodegmatis]
MNAAAFGRLCVETLRVCSSGEDGMAAAFGRLCVETSAFGRIFFGLIAAAFGRLCVETQHTSTARQSKLQPPSGGCVLKLYQQ